MKKIFFSILFIMTLCVCGNNNPQKQNDQTTSTDIYLFSYFIGNGEDGLHLAYSTDGLKWMAMNNGDSYLKPQLGKDKLMRDPSIVQDDNGIFHMVWTTGWWDKGIGYASSNDLMNWSVQKEITVMRNFA